MDRLVVEHGFVGPNDVSKELKKLKVRFDELTHREEDPHQTYESPGVYP